MTLSKRNALLKQTLMTLKRQIPKGKENEIHDNEPTKLEQILTHMENIPLKSDLDNMAKGLFTKLTQYFEIPNTNVSQEGIATRTATENTKKFPTQLLRPFLWENSFWVPCKGPPMSKKAFKIQNGRQQFCL